MKNKEHLTIEGIEKLVSINWGINSELKKAFPEILCVDRPLIENKNILDPNWVAGFAA